MYNILIFRSNEGKGKTKNNIYVTNAAAEGQHSSGSWSQPFPIITADNLRLFCGGPVSLLCSRQDPGRSLGNVVAADTLCEAWVVSKNHSVFFASWALPSRSLVKTGRNVPSPEESAWPWRGAGKEASLFTSRPRLTGARGVLVWVGSIDLDVVLFVARRCSRVCCCPRFVYVSKYQKYESTYQNVPEYKHHLDKILMDKRSLHLRPLEYSTALFSLTCKNLCTLCLKSSKVSRPQQQQS